MYLKDTIMGGGDDDRQTGLLVSVTAAPGSSFKGLDFVIATPSVRGYPSFQSCRGLTYKWARTEK